MTLQKTYEHTRVLQNPAIVLAVIPTISRLRVLLYFVGKILMLALLCDDKHGVLG